MPIHILILTTFAALLQVAGLMLLVRGILWLLGPKVRVSFVYGIFTVGSMPFIRLARKFAPNAIPDRYMPAIAFVLVCAVWVALALGLQALCGGRGAQCG